MPWSAHTMANLLAQIMQVECFCFAFLTFFGLWEGPCPNSLETLPWPQRIFASVSLCQKNICMYNGMEPSKKQDFDRISMGFRWLRFGKLELWPSCLGFFTSQFAPNCARSVPSLVPMPCRMLSAWTDFRLKAQVATTNYLVGHWWFHICFKFRSMFEMMIQHDYIQNICGMG